MTALFDPARHEPLNAVPWSKTAAREAIGRIADDAFQAFDAELGWLAHPLDDPETPETRFQELYFGAGGVVWALEHLARAGAIERQQDFGPFVAGIVKRNRAQMGDPLHGAHSFLLGDAGLLLLQWTLQPSDAVAAQLLEVVRSNLRNTALEQLWGSPGSLLAAIFMAEVTAGAEWIALLREGMQILWQQMETHDEAGGHWLWVQDLYGRRYPMLGAGHGFAGNVFPAFRGAAFLDPALVQGYADRALQTLQATALRDKGRINWHPMVAAADKLNGKLPLVQDCHGAPGIVCRLATAPRSPAWDELLLGAGELTWHAGPLSKGVAFCHGTAGSALALLKLWRRTGDLLWLDRARALAMHALGQSEAHRLQHGRRRYSLWTGDLGLVCVLWACVQGSDGFPTLDVV